MRSCRFLIPVLLTTFFVSACDTATTPGAIDSTAVRIIEPCELISRVEAEHLLGTRLLEGETSEQERVGLKLCVYHAAGDSLGPSFQITITQSASMARETLASGTTPASIFQSIKYNFEDE
jgi:hypothetical protein